MTTRIGFSLILCFVLLVPATLIPRAPACCPAPPQGRAVVNADQSVIIIWDAATKTEHFIRQASFKSEADDFGFLIPTPAQPQLEESGNETFAFLSKLTAPDIERVRRPSGGVGCACGGVMPRSEAMPDVRVLDKKLVAGFDAVVLEASSANALVTWLKDHGYYYSPEIEAWAKPYVDAGWKITALKIAKEQDGQTASNVTATALRMSFQTDRPLFPYREPDYGASATELGANQRLLRIYFVGEARYEGELTKDVPWTGRAAWSGKLTSDARSQALELLKMPATTGPADWWLTEFEDPWPYRVAPTDLYFSVDSNQNSLKRPPMYQYVSSWPTSELACMFLAVGIVLPLYRRIFFARKF